MASDDVIKLDFPLNVRTRPGMYLGEMNCPDVILREAIDNSIDELYAFEKRSGKSKSDTIWIEMINGKTYLVADNGRGIPIKESSEKGITMARLAVGSLSAGSKFSKTGLAIGTNGVGISCANATSSQFRIMSKLNLHNVDELPGELKEKLPSQITDSTYYFCDYEKGIFKEEGFKEFEREGFKGEHPSTITIFSPDPEMYTNTRAKLPTSLPYVTYIMKHLGVPAHIYVNGEEYKDSLTSFGFDIDVTIKTKKEGAKNPDLRFLITFNLSDKLEPCEIIGSVNGLDCRNGVHIRMAQNAFCRAFSQTFSDCRRYELMGLKMGVVVLCNEPSFSSQTKEKLADVDGFKSSGDYEVSSLAKEFKKIFEQNYEIFKNHELKILEYLKSTEKIGRKEFIKSTVLIASNSNRADAFTPRKLTDCSGTNRRECELFICFTGDTEILDCNNNRIRFDELTERVSNGEEIYTFSCSPEGEVVPSKIVRSQKIKEVDKLVKVNLDNGESFRCTPDHKIMMLDGTYKEAKDLETGDSCMPLYIWDSHSDNYGGCIRRRVRTSNKLNRAGNFRSDYVYRVMSNHPDVKSMEGQDLSTYSVHHLDENPLNDSPLNLVKCNKNWHFQHHGGLSIMRAAVPGTELHKKLFEYTNERITNLSNSLKEFFSSEEGAKAKENLREKAKAQWSDENLREWKANDNRRWCEENPELASKRSKKSADTSAKRAFEKVVNEVDSQGLEHTFDNYNKVAKELSPKRFTRIQSLIKRGFDVQDFHESDEWSSWTRRVLDNLKGGVCNRKTFNESVYELAGYVNGIGYLNCKKYAGNLIDEYCSKTNLNHKVESIEFETVSNEPVYCLEVDSEYHNFPLAAGIFVKNCEGDSAKSSLVKCRNPEIHALLGLRGKPLNTTGLEIEQVLSNQEMKDLISSIGVGVNDYHDMSEVRYGKVIIVADADPDGKNIDALVLGALATHLTFLVNAGCVYVAKTPLYRQNGKYYFDEKGLDKTKPFSRFKGLGEANPEELEPFVYDKNQRQLIKITMDNWEDARDMLTSASAKKGVMLQRGIMSESIVTLEE